jgi:hypothetical protein
VKFDFSIVTPSFNQAQFLPRTLASVRNQKGVSLEHIVVDPGSSDGSIDILKQAPDVRLVLKPDKCQSEGINNGFLESTGELLAWLNSDDMYFSDTALQRVKATFDQNPGVDIVYAAAVFVGESDEFLKDYYVYPHADRLADTLQYQVGICQPAVFWRRRVYENVGGLDQSYQYQLDYEYWIRMTQAGFRWLHLKERVAAHRWWAGMKTASKRGSSLDESLNLVKQRFGYVHYKWAERMAAYEVGGADGIVNTTAKASAEDIERATASMLALVNGDSQTAARLAAASEGTPMADTRKWMSDRGVNPAPDFHDIASLGLDESKPSFLWPEDAAHPSRARRCEVFEATGGIGYAAYRVSPEYAVAQKLDHFQRDQERLAAYLEAQRKANRGRTVVVVANGPSLTRSIGEALFKFDLIISNFAYKDARLCKHAKYFTIVNHMVAEQVYADWRRIMHLDKIVPFWLGKHVARTGNTQFVNATVVPAFSADATRYVSWRSTVSYFNMQIAAALGYETILLVGFDNSYVQPKEMKEGDVIHQKEDDPNHFLPDYFKGKLWQAADTDAMTQSYLNALQFCLDGKTRIYNCTVGGKLEVFPRRFLSDFEQAAAGRSHAPPVPTRKLSHTELKLAAAVPRFREALVSEPHRSIYDWRELAIPHERVLENVCASCRSYPL